MRLTRSAHDALSIVAATIGVLGFLTGIHSAPEWLHGVASLHSEDWQTFSRADYLISIPFFLATIALSGCLYFIFLIAAYHIVLSLGLLRPDDYNTTVRGGRIFDVLFVACGLAIAAFVAHIFWGKLDESMVPAVGVAGIVAVPCVVTLVQSAREHFVYMVTTTSGTRRTLRR